MASIEDLKAGHIEPEAVKKTRQTINLSTLTGGGEKRDRSKADLSNLPKQSPDEDPVEIKESIQKEILGPGGPFESYVNEKIKESRAYMEEFQNRSELEKAERADEGADPLDDIDSEDIDTAISEATLRPTILLEPVSAASVTPVVKEEQKMDDNMQVIDLVSKPSAAEVVLGEPSVEMRPIEVQEPVDEIIDEEAISEEPDPVVLDDTTEEQSVIEEDNDVAEQQPVQPQPVQPSKPKNTVAQTIDNVTRKYMAIDDEEDEVEEEEVTTDTSTEEDDEEEARLNELKALITEKIKPVAKRLDLSTFTVSNKGTMSNNILNGSSAAVAKWVLPATGAVIEMREISGTNIENLREHLERNVPNIRAALKIIYDHITSPKPESFEVWLKSIAFTDYDHLFMAIYIASFAEANYLPIDCQAAGCGKVYLTDSVPIMSMVDFKDKESEDKFWKLYKSEPTNGDGLYTTEVVALSDKIAVSFVEPSLYSVLIENQYFDNDFQEKYSQIITQLPYIDRMYSIDAASHQLIPIEWKEYPTNAARTARSKVQRYHKIINSLPADQNAIITACINAINDRINWFTYQLPETTCPKCGHVNPAQKDQAASALVFLRSRLAVLATI